MRGPAQLRRDLAGSGGDLSGEAIQSFPSD